MNQPPYGGPPPGAPHGQPQPAFGQQAPPAPPPYLGGSPAPGYGAPAGFGGFGGFGGANLQGLAPASKPRTVGLVVGLATTFGLLLFVLVVAIITASN